MKVSFKGDLPTWLVAAWVAVGVVWVTAQLVLDRLTLNSLAARRVPTVPSGEVWSPTEFALSPYERRVFGLRQTGDVVTFGPSGRQIAAATLLPTIAVIFTAIVLASHATPIWQTLVVVVAILASAYGLAGLRVRVWMSLDALTMRGRLGRTMRLGWDQIEAVTTRLDAAALQQRGGSTNAVVGVVHVPKRSPMPIPGFRCLEWSQENEIDRQAVTYTKVAVVVRYRQSLVGPWPLDELSD